MAKPVLNTQEVRICDDGDLPKGFYFYVLVGVDDAGQELFVNIMQVNAWYKRNSIHIFWDPVKGMNEYRLYRGTGCNSFEGYFTVYGEGGYFHDDGNGILNARKLDPYGIE